MFASNFWGTSETLVTSDADTPAVTTSGGSDVSVVENTIYFNTSINESSVMKFNTELKKLDTQLACKALMYGIDNIPIKLHISSGGGTIVYGASAMDNILSCKMPIHTVVDGVCASAATFMSIVGTHRSIYRNSVMMIHQLSGSFYGKHSELIDNKENLDMQMKFIKDLYLKRAKIPAKKLDEILSRDLMLNAELCLEYGLVDEII
jgi:ATP-dependent protease ClpP protease subunit